MKSLSVADGLVLVNLTLTGAGAGLALLAQVNWSLWRYVGPAEFPAYHVAWWQSIWWAIFPLAGLALVGVVGQLWWRPAAPGWMPWLALGIQIVGYLGTAFWWGPGQAGLKHALLPDGTLDPDYIQFVNTNWLRVAIFSAAALMQLWIGFVHFAAAAR